MNIFLIIVEILVLVALLSFVLGFLFSLFRFIFSRIEDYSINKVADEDDYISLPKAASSSATNNNRRRTTLITEVALPNQTTINEAFDVAVLIRPPRQTSLREIDLDKLEESRANIYWPQDKSYINLSVQIISSNCTIKGDNKQNFQLYIGKSSPVLYFQLTPQKVGKTSIIVNLYEISKIISSIRVITDVQNRRTDKIELNVISHRFINPQERIIEEKKRRLYALELMEARNGHRTGPEILIEIEDLKEQIRTESDLLG